MVILYMTDCLNGFSMTLSLLFFLNVWICTILSTHISMGWKYDAFFRNIHCLCMLLYDFSLFVWIYQDATNNKSVFMGW